MKLKLITPEKAFFIGQVDTVTVPGSQGEFGVLDGHTPFVSTLRPGIVTIEQTGGETRKILVLSGIAEVDPEHCVVLAETAIDVTQVTQTEAQTKLQEAKKLTDEAVTEAEKKDAAFKLSVAETLVQAL
ncbi:MAG: ATP synthase F1 subunit epsilon [Rickettsiales bacterium]|nr:ATP synthase F1 subunit epsilon [Rickettsiales bacterium]